MIYLWLIRLWPQSVCLHKLEINHAHCLCPGRGKRFFLFQNVLIGSGIHPASYSVGKAGSFTRCRAARSWGRSLIFIQWLGTIPLFPVCHHGVFRKNLLFTFVYYLCYLNIHTYIHTYMCVYVCSLLCMRAYNISIPHIMKYKSFIVSVTIKFCCVSHKLVRIVMAFVTNNDDYWVQ